MGDLRHHAVRLRTAAAAVTAPAPFTLGNAPRFAPDLRADATHHADVNIAKNFRILEGLRDQRRGEFYDITNTPGERHDYSTVLARFSSA